MYTGQERRDLQAAARRADDKKWADHRLEAENERLREQAKQIGKAFDALNDHFKKHPPGDVVGDLLLDLYAASKLWPAVGWDGDLRADVARLTAERDARQWLPIETAPKDGTSMLLAREGRVTEGRWEPEQWPVAAEYHGTTGEYLGQHETGQCIEAYWASADGGFADEHPPTHWMPLPPAPVAALASIKQEAT